MDILKGKRYDIMNVLWEEGRHCLLLRSMTLHRS